MWKLTLLELKKLQKRPRTYISFVAIWSIVALIQLALYVDGKTYMEFFLKDVADSFDIVGNPLNGYFVCFVILQTLLVHVPLLIALVSGDMISGEANMGTLRLLASPLLKTIGLADWLLHADIRASPSQPSPLLSNASPFCRDSADR